MDTMNQKKVFPREPFKDTVYLKAVVKDPSIIIGDFTMYNDWINDPTEFEKNNVLYHYPINKEKLIMGKYCSIACGAKFMFTSGNHAAKSLANYPFSIFMNEWGLQLENITDAWDNKGDIIIGNDVWIGYEAVIMQGVHIGDGAIIGTRAVVTKDVAPYEIVAGVPAKSIKKRFSDATVAELLKIKWWDWQPKKVQINLDAIINGKVDKFK